MALHYYGAKKGKKTKSIELFQSFIIERTDLFCFFCWSIQIYVHVYILKSLHVNKKPINSKTKKMVNEKLLRPPEEYNIILLLSIYHCG